MFLTKSTVGFLGNDNYVNLLLNMSNRHGLIAGATGTGKTITLRKLAEIFSLNNIPVFLVDIKGDLSGLVNVGKNESIVSKKIKEFKLSDNYLQNFPVRFWDIFGDKGIPLRIALKDLGVLFLSRLLNLNFTQEGVLNLAFKVSQDKEFDLVSIDDLRALLKYLADNYKDYQDLYGNVSLSTIGAIQRQLLVVENEGGNIFFGTPSLNIKDFFHQQDFKGVINILNAEKLVNSPSIFSSFLLWMLVKLFETLPEEGDEDKPKFVMFFDESHLLFSNALDTLINEIEKVVRLIRSKSVGLFFCTQNPLDIPNSILSQLGNKIQHSLRSFTVNDQKVIKAVAQTFRSDESVNNLIKTIGQLELGEALVSFLDEKGVPNIVKRVHILPPSSQIEPLKLDELFILIKKDILYSKYNKLTLNSSKDKSSKLKNANKNLNIIKKDKYKFSLLDGFFRGLLGTKNKPNVGVVYDLSNQIGKVTSKGFKKNIKNIIYFFINKLFK